MNNVEYLACLRQLLADPLRSPTHTRELIKSLRGGISGFSPAELITVRTLQRALEECDQRPLQPPGLGTI
jgi:hypothetical protein